MVLAVLARRLSSAAPLSIPPLRFSAVSSSFPRAMSTGADDKKIYLLKYEYVADILEKRGPFRAVHLQNALDLKAQGKIVMGGALVDPVDAGLIVFSTNDKSEIEAFAKNDPYVQNNLVTSYSIREWMVVV